MVDLRQYEPSAEFEAMGVPAVESLVERGIRDDFRRVYALRWLVEQGRQRDARQAEAARARVARRSSLAAVLVLMLAVGAACVIAAILFSTGPQPLSAARPPEAGPSRPVAESKPPRHGRFRHADRHAAPAT